MATIVPVPIVLNDIVLVIGTDNYEAAVSRAELVPTTPKVRWKGMTPTANTALVGTPTWIMNLDFAQDHVTANSVSQYLLANVGQSKTVTLKPKKPATGTAPMYTIDVVIEPGPIGGAVDELAVGSVSLECNGQPVRTLV
jgi:hypothetical protein